MFYTFCVKANAFAAGDACTGCGQLRGALPDEQHHPARRQTRLGQGLHPLHGLHLLLSHRGD